MRSFEDELRALRDASLLRHLRPLAAPQHVRTGADGRPVVNFSSNDYLGLAAHPAVVAALARAVEKHGAGSGASRLVCGTLGPHVELEETLAAFKGTEAALSFTSGYAAAVGTLGAVLRAGDVAILDKLAHASLIDGAKLSGATLRVFPHNDLAQLAKKLAWAADTTGPDGRILVVTESVFSMDGDTAPLAEISTLCRAHGALLLVDEAHAFGLLGQHGRGLADALGVAPAVDFHLGTLSKAAGLAGGYVATSRAAVDLMVNRARSFVYSTAPPPALAAAATHVIREIFPSAEGDSLRRQLAARVGRFTTALNLPAAPAGIVPLIVGGAAEAVALAGELLHAGFLVPAIRYPTVPNGQARLRVTLSAAHATEDIDQLAAALATCRPALAGH